MGKLEQIQNRPQKLKGVKPTPVLRVKRLSDGAECIIDAAQFDKVRHQKLTDEEVEAAVSAEDAAARVEAARKAERAQKGPENSPYSREQLATMGRDALQELPEWSRAPQGRKRKCEDKGDMVTLILAMRSN